MDKIIHICPSLGRACGIAMYGERVSRHMNDYLVQKITPEHFGTNILLEFEYGIGSYIDWAALNKAREMGSQITTLMHAVGVARHYYEINSMIDELSDNLIVMSDTVASTLRQTIGRKLRSEIHVVPHFSTPPVDNPQEVEDDLVGAHGFAFTKTAHDILARYSMKARKRLLLHSTISQFSEVATTETTAMLSRIISESQEYMRSGDITIRPTHTPEKKLLESLSRCKAIFIPQREIKGYYNCSGSILMSIASLRPVVIYDVPQFADIPDDIVYRMGTPDNSRLRWCLENLGAIEASVDISKVRKEIDRRSINKIAAKLETITRGE